MGPIAPAGPPHARSTLVNGGPVRTTNGVKANGMDGLKGMNRVFPHLDDLTAVTPAVDINWPIRKVLQDGELFAKQADTHLDFRRPDVALQEFIKASIVVLEIVPRHKDYPSLSADRGELHRSYMGLLKRIKAQQEKFDVVKEIVKENNERSGVKPTLERAIPGLRSDGISTESDAGYARPKSVQNASNISLPFTSTSNGHPGGEIINGSRMHTATNGSANGPLARKKPPIQPKPDALHGNALPNAAGNSFNSNQTDLAARFARLRSPELATPTQDPRIRTRPISMPEPSNSTSKPSTTSKYSTTVRALGPTEMPSVPRSYPGSMKTPLDVQIPEMPRPPDAIYSPSRNADSPATINLPSSVPHSSSYLGNGRKNSAPPVSTVGRTPSFDGRQDYFPPSHSVDDNSHQKLERRQDPILPDSTTVSAEDLTRYLRMGSHAVRILLVDVRSREEFDNGHIMSSSIICVEPITLRHGISAEEIAESIVLSPDSELKLFEQRDEFDLVVFYDQSSSLQTNTPEGSEWSYLQDFQNAMYDYGYEKQLKRRPMLLVGGLDAWVDLMGPGSLQSSPTGTSSKVSNRNGTKVARPIGRVPVSREARKTTILRKKTYESRPLSKEEESKWDETLREHDSVESPTALEQHSLDELSYVRTTEDFFRRYPELPAIQESMIAPRPSPPTNVYHEELISTMPTPPARPAPALPRQRSSGISEKSPSATYAMTTGLSPGGSSITIHVVSPGLTGLKNNGVSCYLNSTIQCLSATPKFRNFLIDYRYPPARSVPRKANESTDPPQLLVRNLGNLFGHMWSGQYDFVFPTTFLNYVNAIHHGRMPRKSPKSVAFGGTGCQHDSSEFLDYVLEVLHDELNYKRDRPDYDGSLALMTEQEQDNRSKPNILLACHNEWQRYLNGEDSLTSTMFRGQEVQLTTCLRPDCGYSQKQWQSFTILKLKFPRRCTEESMTSISFNEMLTTQYNNKTADILDEYTCPGCKRKTEKDGARREECISYFPDYLIIELTRFVNDIEQRTQNKVFTQVTFPEKGLDLTPAFIPVGADAPHNLPLKQGQRGPFVYDCYAVIQHLGRSLQGGHYVAIAKSLDKPAHNGGAGSWHKFNDSDVTNTQFSETQKNTSLMFLKRQGT